LTLEVLHRTRSMSETAAQVGRTQPAISQQIEAVEDAVGFDVLHHRRGAIHFTARGEILVQEAADLLKAFEQRIEEIGQIPDERVRIGIPPDLRAACGASLASMANGNVEILTMTSHEVLRAFASGQIDLGIAATPRPLPGSVRTWRLQLSWAGCEPPSQTRKHIRIVSLPRGCLYAGLAADAATQAQLRIERHLMYDSIDEVFRELTNGGVTVVSSHLYPSLGSWPPDAALPPLPKASVNLLVKDGGGDRLAWAAQTMTGGMRKAVGRRKHDTTAGMLRERGVDLRLYGGCA
jgi:DNA-binding transcriptional LysR family regulator